MSTSKQIADYQTDNVILWLDNEEPSYNAYIARIEKYGLFNASTVKRFVIDLWGHRTPDDLSMGRVRWGEVATALNSDIKPGLRIATIKLLNRGAGYHFFSDGALEFFNSKVYPNTRAAVDALGVTYGTLFVTSEQYDCNSPRLYSLRLFHHETKLIDTIGEFQAYRTLDRALSAMRAWAWDYIPVGDTTPEERGAGTPSPEIALNNQVMGALDTLGSGVTLDDFCALLGVPSPNEMNANPLGAAGAGEFTTVEDEINDLLDQLGFGRKSP